MTINLRVYRLLYQRLDAAHELFRQRGPASRACQRQVSSVAPRALEPLERRPLHLQLVQDHLLVFVLFLNPEAKTLLLDSVLPDVDLVDGLGGGVVDVQFLGGSRDGHVVGSVDQLDELPTLLVGYRFVLFAHLVIIVSGYYFIDLTVIYHFKR